MRVRHVFALAAALAGLPLLAAPPVSVEVSLDEDQFLYGETLPVAVRIVNYAGRPLKFGGDDTWLQLSVEADAGFYVAREGEPAVRGEFEVPNAGRATRRVDLSPYFDLSRVGRYRVSATVHVAEINEDLVAAPAAFHIEPGNSIWEQTFAQPTTNSAAALGEVRRYELVEVSKRRSIWLYVRVTNEAHTRVLRVVALAPTLTFSRPDARVDRSARLHVLFQIGSRAFGYHVITPDGSIAIRQTHQYTASRPSLRANEDGTIKVVGGARMKHSTDLPKPVDTPASTNALPAMESTNGAAVPAEAPPGKPAEAAARPAP